MVDYNEWRAGALEDNAPAYVKQAGFPETEAKSASRRFFADSMRDELPCNSPAETWLSARHFSKHAEDAQYGEVRDDVEYNIRKAAEVFGISDDVGKALVHTVAVKTASDSDYGWVVNGERKYPMFDATGVKLAEEYFEANKAKYPFSVRKEIAGNILAKAEEFGVAAGESIRKSAGHGVGRPDNVINELVIRAELCQDPDTALALSKMAERVAEQGAEALAGSSDKIAELVEDVDVIENWRRRYGKDMSAPEDFLFDIDMKQAAALVEDAVDVGGDVLSLSKLAELSDETFDNVFGDGFAESVKVAGVINPARLGGALAALSPEDRNEFRNYLKLL